MIGWSARTPWHGVDVRHYQSWCRLSTPRSRERPPQIVKVSSNRVAYTGGSRARFPEPGGRPGLYSHKAISSGGPNEWFRFASADSSSRGDCAGVMSFVQIVVDRDNGEESRR